MGELKKEDYQEPCCPFDASQWKKEETVEHIDIRRITAKLDELFYEKDYTGAKRLLNYWLESARTMKDGNGEFQMENELMGLCRKLGQGDEAMAHAENALALTRKLGIEDNLGAATAYVNAGTVFKAFGKAEKAIPLFEKARSIYEEKLADGDGRLGGLYNNFALALTDLGRYAEAMNCYRSALDVMAKVEGGEADAAITRLNMANCEEAQKGLEEAIPFIEESVEKAWELLNSEKLPREGYYRFVCEKCIPTFEYYGYLAYAEELRERCR